MSLVPDSEISLNKSLHETDNTFGNRGTAGGCATRLPAAITKLSALGACNSVLDYGTGKGALVERLRQKLPSHIQIDGYDPAVQKWASKPAANKYDLVCCFDVLEHIEPGSIESVVFDISSYASKISYAVIDLQPAIKTMKDGRNAHILLAPCDWWTALFSRHFACNISFVIPHSSGHPQKLVIVSTNNTKYFPLLNLLIHKLQLTGIVMHGGTLG